MPKKKPDAKAETEEKHPAHVVAALQELQEKEGYLSEKSMKELAKSLDVPAVHIYAVATFYSMFKLKKQGRNVISVCRGTACHVKNSLEILEYLEELLNLKPGETTEDEKFTLQCVNCIGACAKAPAMMIGETVYGELTKQKAKKIIEGIN
jgi:NADH-quinone oxidoreductase E subunit